MEDVIAKRVHELTFNRPQRVFIANLSQIKDSKSIWGRGVGKSTVMGYLLHQINRTMPRSCWVLQGASYQQILTRTLPGTIDFLVKMGYRKDVDFYINTFPPKAYALPFNCPLKPDHCLFLVNHHEMTSVAFTFFSQDRASSRGPSRDGILADESLLLDIDKFNEEAKATNRGNELYFGKHPMHHAVYHFSSMPMGKHWLTDIASYYDEIGLSNYWTLRKKQVQLELDFVISKDNKEKVELYREIYSVMQQLKFKPHQGKFYSEYSAFENIAILKPRYFHDLYSDNTELIFRIEVLNERIMQVEDSFYPGLSRDHHCYKGHYDYGHLDNLDVTDYEVIESLDSRQDLDCIISKPLLCGLDFGTAINWMIVAQEVKDSTGHDRINFINNFFVKSPKTIDDVIKQFCDYYKYHENKVLYMYPDGEGNVRRANIKGQLSYVDQIVTKLRKNGWHVIVDKKVQYNTRHKETYILWDRLLDSTNLSCPNVSFNEINCKELIYSMEQTPALDYGGKDIRKDKSSEKKNKSNREEATDAGDAADQIIRWRYGHLLKGSRGASLVLVNSKG